MGTSVHTRLQIDPYAELIVRPGERETIEICFLDHNSESSVVVQISQQMFAIIAAIEFDQKDRERLTNLPTTEGS